MSNFPRLRDKVKIRKDIEGYLVYFSGLVFTANNVSYDILMLCNGKNSKNSIAWQISRKYDADIKMVKNDMSIYLNEYKMLFE
jgi:hypothetical protein